MHKVLVRCRVRAEKVANCLSHMPPFIIINNIRVRVPHTAIIFKEHVLFQVFMSKNKAVSLNQVPCDLSATSFSHFPSNVSIAEMCLKRTSILLQIKRRQSEKRKNTAIHKVITHSMGNSGRITAIN